MISLKQKPDYTIGSVEKACDILFALEESDSDMGVTELAKKLGMTKSTIHKLLLTLEYKGLVDQNPENGKYYISLQFYAIGCRYLHRRNPLTIIRPQMAELAKTYNETVHFGVYSNNEMVIVEKFESTLSIAVTSRIGKVSPLYCTAIGKAIFANLDEEDVRGQLDHTAIKQHTPFTITDKDKLQQELQKIRKNGYAMDFGEYETGVHCVAVPVKDLQGGLIGAISVTGPDFRMTPERMEAIRDDLLNIKLI